MADNPVAQTDIIIEDATDEEKSEDVEVVEATEEEAPEAVDAPEEAEAKADDDDAEETEEKADDVIEEFTEDAPEVVEEASETDEVEEKDDEVDEGEAEEKAEGVDPETKAAEDLLDTLTADIETPESDRPDDALTPEFKDARAARLETLEVKDVAEGDYLCAYERKMFPADATPCATCPGGCADEKGLPGLLTIEGLAERDLEGKVLDSGYSDVDDLFVVDVERKDGTVVEAFYTGEGEPRGWLMLNQDVLSEKSAEGESATVISMTEAEQAALNGMDGAIETFDAKEFSGDVLGVDADIFEGIDAYVVEIEVDGKSYDAFVALDGQFLGYDEYALIEEGEADEVDAEMKRAYTSEQREKLAESGQAMPDGSFPIADEHDLRNAIQAFGRAKNPDAVKAHIKKRAKALGKTDLLPDSWSERKAAVLVDGEPDDELAASLIELELLQVELD